MAPHKVDGHKKHVKFARSKSSISRRRSQSNADSYANIVLYYLSKLKGLFSRDREDTKYYDSKRYDTASKPILKKDTILCPDYNSNEAKQKAYDIVTAALQYGCANDIIEKVGDYFLVRNKSDHRVSTRRPTPGPDYVRCTSCKNLAKCPRKYKGLTDDTEKFKVSSKNRKSHRRYHNEGRHFSPVTRARSVSNSSLVSYCPKCYARLKSNKRLRN